MDFKLIETVINFDVNGHVFTLDIGEAETGEKATALVNACFVEGSTSDDVLPKVREAMDNLLGEGAADKLLATCSATNEVQIRRLGLGIGTAVNKRRVEMILSAFTPEPTTAKASEKAN